MSEYHWGPQLVALLILLKFEKCLCVCLCANSSAVYRPTGAKLGREVGGRHEKHLTKTEF